MLDDLRREVARWTEEGLGRRMRRAEGPPGPRVQVESRELVMCASNNYLGLANDARVVKASADAVRQFGTGATGSPLLTGNTSLHERLESEIAGWKGTESALLFHSGYAANLAVLSSIAREGDTIFSDALNHASIIDGCRLSKARVVVYRHGDTGDLAEKLEGWRGAGRRLIVTDGVFSMDGDIAPVPDLLRLADRHSAWLMVDDAHASGVLGEDGRGTSDHFRLGCDRVPIQVGTLSKALASEGGFVAGSATLVEYLRNFARPFMFSTALSPGAAGAALAALAIVRSEPVRRDRLRKISLALRSDLSVLGFQVAPGVTPIVPVLIGDAQLAVEFGQRLEERGVFAPAIRPPSVPAGTSRIRLALMATHSDEDLDLVRRAFAVVGKELGVIL